METAILAVYYGMSGDHRQKIYVRLIDILL